MHPIRAACTKRRRFFQKVIRKARLRLQAGLFFPAPCRERGQGGGISFLEKDIPPFAAFPARGREQKARLPTQAGPSYYPLEKTAPPMTSRPFWLSFLKINILLWKFIIFS